jgi:cell division septation protein DedD
MKLASSLCALMLLLAAGPLAAAGEATVEAVQSPAWVTRDGQALPLSVGSALRDGDEVRTGVESRAVLRLADGSSVKLGENARLSIQSLGLGGEARRLLRGTLKVLEGAFRFTTSALDKARFRREIDVEFTTVTAGIRGTDIWGRNFGDREVVVLIEGEISVTPRGQAPIPMRDALTYYQAPRQGTPGVAPVPMELLNEWAQQTELQAGALTGAGRWKVSLSRFDNQDEALALYDSLRRNGYPARIRPQPLAGGQVYHVRLEGLSSRAEAEALGLRLQQAYPGIAPQPMRR